MDGCETVSFASRAGLQGSRPRRRRASTIRCLCIESLRWSYSYWTAVFWSPWSSRLANCIEYANMLAGGNVIALVSAFCCEHRLHFSEWNRFEIFKGQVIVRIPLTSGCYCRSHEMSRGEDIPEGSERQHVVVAGRGCPIRICNPVLINTLVNIDHFWRNFEQSIFQCLSANRSFDCSDRPTFLATLPGRVSSTSSLKALYYAKTVFASTMRSCSLHQKPQTKRRRFFLCKLRARNENDKLPHSVFQLLDVIHLKYGHHAFFSSFLRKAVVGKKFSSVMWFY